MPSSPLRPSSPGEPRSPCKRAGQDGWSFGVGWWCCGAALSPQSPHLLSWQASVPRVTLRGGKRSEHHLPLTEVAQGTGPPFRPPQERGHLPVCQGDHGGPPHPARARRAQQWGTGRKEGILGAQQAVPAHQDLLQNIPHRAVPAPPTPGTQHLPSLQALQGSRHRPGHPWHHPRQGPQGPPAREGHSGQRAPRCAKPVPERTVLVLCGLGVG